MGIEKYLDKAYAFSRNLLIVARQNVHNEAVLEAIFDAVEANCTVFREKLSQMGASRFCRSIYRRMDETIATDMKDKAPPISCKRGCAHCCHMFVAATRSEAKHLTMVAATHDIPIDIERLRKQSTMTDDTWTKMPIKDQACVFLDTQTKECRVYNDRPLSCRKYFVTSNPEICNINLNPGGIAAIFCNIEAEIVSTAWMTVDGCGNLAELLLKENQ